jgi:hypothetical protein
MDCIKMHLEVAIKEGSLAKKKPVEEPTDAPAANDVGTRVLPSLWSRASCRLTEG